MDRKAVVKELVKDQLDPAYIFLPPKSRTLSPRPKKNGKQGRDQSGGIFIYGGNGGKVSCSGENFCFSRVSLNNYKNDARKVEGWGHLAVLLRRPG